MAKRTEKLIRNSFVGILSQIIQLITSFVIRTVIIYFLSKELLGINGLFTSILSIFSLADLGFGTALLYCLYKPLKEEDSVKISGIINYFKKVYLVIILIILFLGLACIPFLQFIVNVDTFLNEYYLYYVLFLLNTICSYVFVYKTSILYADQKSYIVKLISMALTILKLVADLISIIVFKSFVGYIVSEGFYNLLLNVISTFYVKKHYQLDNKTKIEEETKKDIKSNVLSLFIYKLFSTLINNFDNIFISIFVGTIVVGIYSNYLLITSNLVRFIMIFSTNFTYGVGNYLNSGKTKAETTNLFLKINDYYYFLYLFVCVCFIGLINKFLIIWTSDGSFVLDKLSLVAIFVNFILSGYGGPISIFRESSGLFKKTKYAALINCCLNIGLSILLGYYWGLFGVLIATSISRLLTNFWFEPYILFKYIFEQEKMKNYFFKITYQMITISLFSLAGFVIVNSISFSSTIIDFLVSIVIVLFLSFIGIVLSCLLFKNERSSMKDLMLMIKDKFSRKKVAA